MKRIVSLLLICLMLTSVAFAANTSVVEYTTGTKNGVTTVTASALATGADDEVKLFTAVYDANGNLAGAKEASSKNGALLKNSVTFDEGQTIKSFAWEGDKNTPIEMPATYGKTTITEADVEITFGGKSFEEFVGSALAFDGTDHVAEYTAKLDESKIGADGNITIPYPEVNLKDNGLYYDVEIDEENLTTTIIIMAGRVVTDELYGEAQKLERKRYEPVSTQTIVVKYVWDMITEDAVTDTTIGFITGNTYYKRSYTFEYAQDDVASAPIEGKSAVLSAISVDGVALDGFSPDVFEYTVPVTAAQTKIPAVTYVVAGNAKALKNDSFDFPGKTEIKVTEGDVENIYTINYVCPVDTFASNAAYKNNEIRVDRHALYEKCGFVVGNYAYTDRVGDLEKATYVIREIYDPSIVGADLIRGSVDSFSNSVYEGDPIPDWITFDAARGGKIIVFDTDTKAKANFEANGFTYAKKSSGYLKTYTTGEKTYTHSYTKTFDANTTVQIPNAAADAPHSIITAIIWDNWELPITDITLHADTINKNAMVILVPKDYTKDVLVSKDEYGTYTEVPWKVSNELSIDAYNYETDENGNPIYRWDASRGVGESYSDTTVDVTVGGNAIGNYAVKKFVGTDGQYVFSSRVSSARHPLEGSHFHANMPEEFYGANYIVTSFLSSARQNVDFKFSVNDNLKKIVLLNIEDVANPTIGSTTSVETTYSGSARPYYTYQSVQTDEFGEANLSISYQIAKGTMTADDVFGDAFKIRRLSMAQTLTDEAIKAVESKMTPELYALATATGKDAFKNHVWFLGELFFEDKELVTDLDLCDNIKALLDANGNYGTKKVGVPEVKKFSDDVAEFGKLAINGGSEANMPGLTVSYPLWLEGEALTYITPSYTWYDFPSGYTFGKEVFSLPTAVNMYSFKVTEDATVMMLTTNSPEDFWALSDGWTKASLTADDRVILCRQQGYNSTFKYTEIFTKDVKKGDIVVIKTPQVPTVVPMVFVKTVDR